MRPFRFAIARVLDAPADVAYHCLADYHAHHRPGGFLPPAFTDLQVLRGGIGAGTLFRFTLRAGGRTRTRTQVVTEPCPGRVLVEQGNGESTTFTVEPRGEHALVRIETVLRARGLERLLLPLLAPLGFCCRELGGPQVGAASRVKSQTKRQLALRSRG
jgi:hypothetical protein